MPGTTDFTVLLRERLAAAEAARADRVRANEDTMRERQIHSERFGHLASLLHQAIVRPMIDELTSHFENVTTEHYQTPRGISTACRFAATDRFPAAVSLLIGIRQDERDSAVLTYDIEIVPLLFDYEKTDALALDVAHADEPAVRERLGSWLLRFTDMYLRLETDPGYQEWHSHTDPVCGMRISGGTAASVLDQGRLRYYFCSELCRRKFEAEPALYASGHGVPAGLRT